MRTAVAVVLDVVMVLVFVVIGRLTHGEADSATGILTTAWPFAIATIVGSLIGLGLRRLAPQKLSWPYGWLAGLIVLVVTVVLGMVLRLVAGGTAAWPFWIVAFVTLGILLLGWRLVARLIVRPRTRTPA